MPVFASGDNVRMFERYTESARRTLFFARYETSQMGGIAIAPEHILVGLTRESVGIVRAILKDAGVTTDDVRADVQRSVTPGERTSTSVEIPFSASVQNVLRFAAQEADALGLSYIGSEHLLLGLLREEKTLAWDVLMGRGLRLADTRSKVAELTAGTRQTEQTRALSAQATKRTADRISEIRLTVTMLGSIDAPPPEVVVGVRQLLDQLDALERDLDL